MLQFVETTDRPSKSFASPSFARPRSLLAAGLFFALGVAVPARAQTPAVVNVNVDATAPGAALERIWSYFGYDELNYTTTTEGKALLATLVAANTAPLYVRTHFLLNTGNGSASLKWGSTNAYTEDAAGTAVYDWTLMDGIMDAITAAGGLPLIEVAFMPQALSTHPTPYQNTGVRTLDGGCFYPPKDYSKWGALIRAWATHVKARYPDVESKWLWELWNEPNIDYWHGTFAEYAKLYDYTEAAIRAVLPNARVGGPAVTAPGTFLNQFLQHCSAETNAVSGAKGTRLDLVSFHAKGGVSVTGGHVQMDLGNQLRLHRDGFNAVAGYPAFKDKPIYITEADPDGCAACPASEIPADAYRNSPAYGAYEIAMMKRTLELEARIGVKVGGLITWAFTFPNSPYFPGYRALTTNGITLPVLGAFKLLGSLAGARLPVTSSGALALDTILNSSVRGNQADVDGMATLDGTKIQVLVWNYHDALVTTPASPVHLAIKVPASFGARVNVAHLRMDESHGDAYTIWTAQGSPAVPSATVLAAMRQGMEPVALTATPSAAVSGGTAAIDFDLPRFGVSLLTLTAADAPADAGTDGAVDAGAGTDAVVERPATGAGGTSGAGGGGGSTPTGGVTARGGNGVGGNGSGGVIAATGGAPGTGGAATSSGGANASGGQNAPASTGGATAAGTGGRNSGSGGAAGSGAGGGSAGCGCAAAGLAGVEGSRASAAIPFLLFAWMLHARRKPRLARARRPNTRRGTPFMLPVIVPFVALALALGSAACTNQSPTTAGSGGTSGAPQASGGSMSNPAGASGGSGSGGAEPAGSGGAPSSTVDGSTTMDAAYDGGVDAVDGPTTVTGSGRRANSGGAGVAGAGGAGGQSAGTGGRNSGGAAGQGGGAGQNGAAATTFVCNQVTAMTLTREWFEAGFQQASGIIDGRWQLKAREHGYITEWANPSSDFWNQAVDSACTTGSASPDHVVLTVLSWVPACCTTQSEWDTQIVKAINTLRGKYAGLKRIDLMTVIRGPGNKACPTAPVAGETIAMPAELDAALASAATMFPGLVFVAPQFAAPDCASFSGGGPHLTASGNTAIAKVIAAHFAKLQ